MGQQEVVCVCHSLSSYSGGVLPILAQQWITEVWGVHSGDSGGGGTAGLCVEDVKSSAPKGQSTGYALRYTITEYFPLAVQQCFSGKPVPHHQLGS